MVVGARPAHVPGLRWARRPARWLLTKLTEYVTGTKISDINSGMRIFPKALARQYLHVLPDGFSFTTTLTVASLCDRYCIAYKPIDYLARVGHSKIVPRNFLDFVSLMLRLSMLFRPLKLFVPIGMASLIHGANQIGRRRRDRDRSPSFICPKFFHSTYGLKLRAYFASCGSPISASRHVCRSGLAQCLRFQPDEAPVTPLYDNRA